MQRFNDACPIVRREIYESMYHFFNKTEFDLHYTFRIDKLPMRKFICEAMNDPDKAARVKGLQFCEKFFAKRAF